MARFALAAPKVQRYYSSLGTPNYFNNNMGGLWADVVNNRRNEAFDDLKWEQDVLTQDQRMSHLEKMQKLHNDHAERMGDVGKNNKWHSLAQGAVGLGASYGASGGFDNFLKTGADQGYSATDAMAMTSDGMNSVQTAALQSQADHIANTPGGFTEWTTDDPLHGGVSKTDWGGLWPFK